MIHNLFSAQHSESIKHTSISRRSPLKAVIPTGGGLVEGLTFGITGGRGGKCQVHLLSSRRQSSGERGHRTDMFC